MLNFLKIKYSIIFFNKNINNIKMFKDQFTTLFRHRYSIINKPSSNKQQDKQQPKNNQPKFQIKTPKGTRDFNPNQMAIRRKVIDTISRIFKKHGAVQIDTPVFQLKEVLTGKYGEDSKLIYDLQDQGGQKCSLRYDLTVPFARYMANNTNIQKIKRFHIGKVYRRDQPTANKGRYRQFYQCDFDIAGKYDPMIPDAEVLVVMQEILEGVQVNNFLVKVNHRKILQAMVECSGEDLSKFKTICSSIDKLDKQPWAQIKEQLIKQKNVSEKAVDILGEFTKYKGQPFAILQKLVKQNVFKEKGHGPLQQMRTLFNYLKAFKKIGKVSFDLSLARGLDYYTGVIFQIVLTDKKSQLGSISGGGRYDDLIGMFSQHQIPSVGGSIGIERIFTIIQNNFKAKVKTNECEVLVATIGKLQVAKKLQILGQLWNANIKAETLYVDEAKADKQLKHAFDNEIPFILWIGESQLESGLLNLKNIYKRDQVKVSLKNLIEQLKPHLNLYRQDFVNGLVKFEQPEKKKK